MMSYSYDKHDDANFADNNRNKFCKSGEGKAYILDGGIAAVRLNGDGTKEYRGVVRRVLILSQTSHVDGVLTIYDSKNTSNLSTKRRVEIGISGAAKNRASFAIPLDFAFDEGLVIVQTDASDEAKIVLQVEEGAAHEA